MQDKRKIKEIYNCISISSNEELYPLQKWYNQLIEKTIAEITEKVSEMDSSFLISYADDLKNIIKNALVKSETRDWIYAGEEEEFKDMIDTLSKKIM